MVNEFSSSVVRNFIDVVQKSFFAVHILLYTPKKHFIDNMHFVRMASHITCIFGSEFSINFYVEMSMCVYILKFLHIVLCRNAWCK